MTKEDNSLFEEVAFRLAQFQSCFLESSEDWTQPLQFHFEGCCMHDDVIKIQTAHLPRGTTTQHPFHEPLKCSRCIAEPKRHQGELIKATPCSECYLQTILLFNSNPPVTTCKIECTKRTWLGQISFLTIHVLARSWAEWANTSANSVNNAATSFLWVSWHNAVLWERSSRWLGNNAVEELTLQLSQQVLLLSALPVGWLWKLPPLVHTMQQ